MYSGYVFVGRGPVKWSKNVFNSASMVKKYKNLTDRNGEFQIRGPLLLKVRFDYNMRVFVWIYSILDLVR